MRWWKQCPGLGCPWGFMTLRSSVVGNRKSFKIMSWNTGVIYIVLFVTPFFFERGYMMYIYIYICGWHLGPSGARISWFMGNLDQPLTRSDVLITSADGSRVFLGKRKALPAARVCWKRGVSMDPNLGNLSFQMAFGNSADSWDSFSLFPFSRNRFFWLGASSTGLASWPIQIRFMVFVDNGSVKHRLVGFFRWGFGGRAKPGESPQEAVCLVRILGKMQGEWLPNCRLQHVWCEGSSVFHFQLHVLRLVAVFFWNKTVI